MITIFVAVFCNFGLNDFCVPPFHGSLCTFKRTTIHLTLDNATFSALIIIDMVAIVTRSNRYYWAIKVYKSIISPTRQ